MKSALSDFILGKKGIYGILHINYIGDVSFSRN